MTVSWSKDQRKIANEEFKSLFYVAIDGRHLPRIPGEGPTGRYEHSRPLDLDLARKLFYFCHYCALGQRPAEVFKEQFGG